MPEKKPRFNMKREPQTTAEVMVRLLSDVLNEVMSDQFQKSLYLNWAGQDKLYRK